MTSQNGKRSTPQNASFIGGIIGLVTFLVVGLLPSLLYGGYAGLILGTALFGSPVHESIFAQATVVMGVLCGLLAVGGLFVLGGAILASGIWLLAVSAMPEPEPEAPPAENEAATRPAA